MALLVDHALYCLVIWYWLTADVERVGWNSTRAEPSGWSLSSALRHRAALTQLLLWPSLALTCRDRSTPTSSDQSSVDSGNWTRNSMKERAADRELWVFQGIWGVATPAICLTPSKLLNSVLDSLEKRAISRPKAEKHETLQWQSFCVSVSLLLSYFLTF